MSTPKEQIMPGTFVVVDNKGKGINSPVFLSKEMKLGDRFLQPSVGEILLVVSKKFKKDGINFVRVFWQGTVWMTYYCTIRYSTTPQKTSTIPTKEEAKILLEYGKILREDVAKRFAKMNIPG